MTRKEKIEHKLQADPNDVFLNYSYAMELAKIGESDAARTAFQRTRELDPNCVAAYFQEGQLLAGIDDNDSARRILETGIEVARRVHDDHALAEMTSFLDNL